MATWHEITRDPEYQELTPEGKSLVKKGFFDRVIAADPEYQTFSEDTKKAIFDDFWQTPDDTGQGYVTSMLGAAGRGFGEMVPGAIEGVGALTGSEGLREFGQDVRGGLESISPVNPIYGESIPVKLAGVGGQVGSMLATAGAGGLAGKALGGVGAATTGMRAAPLASAFLQGSAEGAREAEQYGMTGPEAYLRTLAGGATEAGTELLPFGMAAETALAKRILTGAPRTGTFLGAVGSEAGEEGLGQIASNIATKTLAPDGVETPDITAGALEAAAYGAAGGAMLGGVNALISTPPERQTQIQQDLQAEAGAIPKDTVPDQTNEEKMAAMEKGGVTVVSPDGKTAVIAPEPSMPDPAEVAKTIGETSVEQLAATGNKASAAAQKGFNAILAENLGETPEPTIQPEQEDEDAGAEVTPLSEGAERNRAVIAEAAAKLRGEAPKTISAGVKAAIPQQPVETQEDAPSQIPLEESLRQEPQDRVESREAEETGAGDQLLRPAEGEKEVVNKTTEELRSELASMPQKADRDSEVGTLSINEANRAAEYGSLSREGRDLNNEYVIWSNPFSEEAFAYRKSNGEGAYKAKLADVQSKVEDWKKKAAKARFLRQRIELRDRINEAKPAPQIYRESETTEGIPLDGMLPPGDLGTDDSPSQEEVITPPGELTTATEGMVTPGGVATERETDEQRFQRIKALKPSQRSDDDIAFANEFSKRQKELKPQAGESTRKAFLANHTASIGGRLRKALDQGMNFRGLKGTVGSWVENLYNEGWRMALDARGNRQFTNGTEALGSSGLGKVGMNYADFLSSQPQTTKAAEKQTPVPLREGTGAAGVVQSEPVEGSIPTVEKVSPETESESSEKLDPKLVEAEQKQAKEEEAAVKQQEKLDQATKSSLNSVVGPQKKNDIQGTVTKADVEAARAALTNSGEIPNAYLTNVYESREAFLADRMNSRLFPASYARLQTEKNIEGLFENGQTLVFAKEVQVSDLDRGLAKMLGVSDEQAAARRVIAHENGHRAISLFTMAEKRELRGYLMRAYSEEQIAKLVERYTEYADWRTNPESRLEALEELLMRDFEKMERIPTGGVWDDIVQFLKRVWRRLTGQKGEPNLKELKDVVRLMRNAMKRPAVPLGSFRLKDGGEVKLSMIAPTAGITPEMDAEYLAAVEQGDSGNDNLNQLLRDASPDERQAVVDSWIKRNPRAAARMQRIVKEAAKAAGYDIEAYHGASSEFNVFDAEKILNQDAGIGFYFTKDEDLAKSYASRFPKGKVFHVFLKQSTPLRTDVEYPETPANSLAAFNNTVETITKDGQLSSFERQALKESLSEGGAAPNLLSNPSYFQSRLRAFLDSKEFQNFNSRSKAYLQTIYDVLAGRMGRQVALDTTWALTRMDGLQFEKSGVFTVLRPNQIKSASPVTFDNVGNIIPPPQRFQPTSPDIRFSRPQFSSDTSAAISAGSEAARSTLYSERDMDIREAIRRAYEAMPKTNSVAVPIGELFAKTEELMPGVTQEEFSLVLQDLFEDNGAVLQEGDVVEPLTEQDRRYLALAQDEDANRKELQRMVDEAAKAAGYDREAFKAMPEKDWRTDEPINVIKSTNGPWAGFFTDTKKVADKFGRIMRQPVRRAFLKLTKPFEVDASGKAAGELQFDIIDDSGPYAQKNNAEILAAINSGRYDGIVLKNTTDEGTVIVPLDPSQIKSADPVTRDDQGRIIPLSRRFDTGADIRGQINVTTPEGRRAGFVVVMPRAAKASRIKAEDATDAAKTFQADIIEAGKGRIDTASYQGNTLKSTEAPDHNENAPELYRDAAISLVDSLLSQGHSITDIADSFQDPEFRVAVGLLGNKAINPNVAQQAELFIGAEIQNRLENSFNKERNPAKKRLIEKTLKNHKAYYTTATGIGQNLNAVGALQQDPRFKWMFIFNEAEKEMADKAKEKLDTITGGGTQPVTDTVNKSEEAAADEATKQIEESVEEDEDAALFAEGEASLQGEAKSIWERMKDILRKIAFLDRLDKRDASSAKASLSEADKNTLSSLPKEERAKKRAEFVAEFIALGKIFMGEGKASDTPAQKATRQKRKKMVDTAKKRAESGKEIEVTRIQIQSFMDELMPGYTERKSIVNEVGDALLKAAEQRKAKPRQRTAIQDFVSAIKQTLMANIRGDKISAEQPSLGMLLAKTFAQQGSEAEAFAAAWANGRKKVRGMLAEMGVEEGNLDAELDAIMPPTPTLAYAPAAARKAVSNAMREAGLMRSDLLNDPAASKKAIMEKFDEAAKSANLTEEGWDKKGRALAEKAVDESIAEAKMAQERAKKVAKILSEQAEKPVSLEDFGAKLAEFRFKKDKITELFNRAKKLAERKIQMANDQAIRVLLAAENKLAQSAFFNASEKPDTIVKAFREQVEEPMERDAFKKRMEKMLVTPEMADKLFDRAARERDNARWKKAQDLLEGPNALQNLLRQMNMARPGEQAPFSKQISWREILSQKAKTVEEYRQRIFDAISANEAFQNLSDEQKGRLSDLFSEAWESKRTDILDRMLEREIDRKRREGSLSEAAAKALQKSRNKIIELANLGGFDNDDLMKVLGEKFGIKTGFSEAEKARISELADKLQDETLNPAKRNKLAMEFAVTLAGASEIPVSEIIANWWTSSVLFGPQTIFSIGAAFLNGGYNITTIGLSRMIDKIFRKSPDIKGAIEESILMLQGIAKYLGAFKQAGRRAWSYLWTGNVDVLGAAANDILGEINSLEELKRFKRHKLLAENLAKDPRALRRYVGMYLRFVNRLLTSLDAFNVMVTKAGTASLALRMSGMSTDNIIKAEKMLNLKAYKDQVIRDYFDNKAPTTQAGKALVDSYAEAEMYRAVDQLGGKMENADYLASESAMTMNPTGLGGFFYRSITGLDNKMKKAAEDYLEKAKKDWTTEKDLESTLFLGLAYLRQFAVQNLGGVAGYKFIRFASNKFNQGISYLPMVGLLRTLEAKGDDIKGKEAFIETIHRNQVIGAVLTLAAIAVVKALEDEPDDEERGNFWNGGWQNLTPDQKKQMLAKGQKEYTMGFKFNGRWYVFNYQNWPLNQVLAAIGSMSDQIRFSPKQWEEKGPLSKSLAGIVSGLKSTLEIPALSQLGTLVGNRLASKDPTEQTVDRLSNVAAGWVGGFVPRILKDLDFATQPELRKYKTLWEKTASHIPIYRRYVGEDYYDILGQPIKRNVIPGSREFMMGPTEPEYKILGALNSRNIFLTPANAEYRMVGKGRNRRRLTQEEADAYSLETGKGYRQMLLRYGQRALQMPTERARAFLSDKADEVRDRALKKVYRR